MQWSLPIHIKPPLQLIDYPSKIMLLGSCFSEHIGTGLSGLKFDVLQNPHGILFAPDAIIQALSDYVECKIYGQQDLFQSAGIWYSWNHHSRFSGPDPAVVLQKINSAIQYSNAFIKQTNFLIITLGSAFSYRLTELATLASKGVSDQVANCHRAPSNWFNKELMTIDHMVEKFAHTLQLLKKLNPAVTIFFTISPVRHIRDGVQDNNRSKARLFETVQRLEEKDNALYYFPAYELVVDVLRDYRFYDVDLVHPNYAATEFVINHFIKTCLTTNAQELAEQIKKIQLAFRHRPQHPTGQSHQQFLTHSLEKARALQKSYPLLDLSLECNYFEQQLNLMGG
ncbi:MAG: GSCFA domain-containing protein [Bacteroidetes bacterium]|nr:GSCFA domain-containing protein [Bacteroidota bacterium]